MTDPPQRADALENEIAVRFEAVRERLDVACRRSGRDPSMVTLVAVSKRQPLERVEAAYALGHRIFGESRVQDAAERIPRLPRDLEWHFIGPLQSNKVKTAAPLFSCFHAVDRVKIARLLSKEGEAMGRRLRCYVQVNVGEETSKHGVAPGPEAFERDVRPLADLRGLEIAGLMAIPPYEPDPEGARRWFRRLAALRDQAAGWPEWSGFEGLLSMGMSHDLEIAVEEGATAIRVGTDLFGPRPTSG